MIGLVRLHTAGDAVLQHFASLLVNNVRDSDVVGRLGGDEFGVILAQADRAQAEIKAASLVEELEKAPVIFEGRAIRLRASFGVRPFEKDLDAARMMAEADAAMFLRKGERRATRGWTSP